ncbi:hypothetical protein BDB01DRAFT_843894 [Pilobolus umbonatus]|nr:hypothetical protein BDB01DRAFT_843894 [Pilobolus umbonatus]
MYTRADLEEQPSTLERQVSPSQPPQQTIQVDASNSDQETRRVEIIRNHCKSSPLNKHARDILIDKNLTDNSTNRAYKKGQHIQKPGKTFSHIDLNNFATITQLHPDLNPIRNKEDINQFIKILLNRAPTIRIHEPTITHLRHKLAFLLGITCFLRPSDLHRIPYISVSVHDTGSHLYFENRHCAIHTFVSFRNRRPKCSAPTLFINSLRPNSPLKIRTIQARIPKLLKLSSSETRLSLRSIAPSPALQSGIPKEDI